VSDLSARTVQRLLSERDLVALFAMGLAVLAVFSLVTDTFFTVISFQVMGFQVAEVALLSLAVMLSMLTGGIDLSIVSVASISALVVAKGFQATNAATAPSDRALWLTVGFIALGLVAGIGCGLMNAFLIAKLRITPILATLATLQILNGVGIAWTGGVTVYGMPNQFLNIGSGYVFHIPIPVLILLGAAVLTAIFVNRTGIGLRVRLVGANPVAARYSGLNPTRVLFATYVASALLASIAAASASADYGASYLLLAIVIVVLGGVSPLGGYGTVTGVVLSAWVLQMVSTGFNMVNFSTFAYLIAQGVILIGVIGLNTLTQRYGGNWRSRLLPSARRAAAAGDPSTARTR
jgi:simple sugar transport system permease protein